MIALFLVPLFLLTPVIFAAGDNIRVVSSDREVHFPGEVLFDLEVEAEAEIVEVTLYHRVAPSGTWTYAYPAMTPSRRVETRFNLSVSGISYLPPGTTLEYYYSIRDAHGNILETEPETLVYVDDRFRWQNLTAGPLTIFWHDRSQERVTKVAQQVEQSLAEIAALLHVNLDTPVRGIIYNSRSEAVEAFPYQSQTITEEQVFQGFAFPARGVFVGIGLHPSLIIHESAHLILGQATASPRAKVPAWLNEGFASYVEPGAHGSRRSLPSGASPDLIPLRQMNSLPGRPEAIRYFYRKAEGVVGYLLDTHGPSKFRAFVEQLNQGKDVDGALINAYGFGVEGLDQGWSSGLAQQGGQGSNGSSPFAYSTTLLIAILALVVMGISLANFTVGRLRRRREGQEQLTEDEWEGRP